MTEVRIDKLNGVAKLTGVETAVVRAVIGLSKPVRAGVKLTLVKIKQNLQGKVLEAGLKKNLIKRKKIEIAKAQGAAQRKLSEFKLLLNMLQIGPDFRDNAAFQGLINLLLSNVKVKGLSIGGYRDMDNALNVVNFNAQQLTRALNTAELMARAINDKIDEVDKFINLLDAVDNL